MVSTRSSESLGRIPALDGVRGCSILLVLAGHLLPLGPKVLDGNSIAASAGMAMFFVLSGFLVARILYTGSDIRAFLIRRLMRIAPLAYLFAVVVFFVFARDAEGLRNILLFISNYTNGPFAPETTQLWSLCVEVQFYLAMALGFWLLGKNAKWLVLIAAPTITILRVMSGDGWSIMTHLRGDELLAGSLLYLSLSGAFGDHSRLWAWAGRLMPLIAIVFAATCTPLIPVAPLFRAYPAVLFVGALVCTPYKPVERLLASGPLRYVAEISYALYVVHLACAAGPLSGGDKTVLYLVKRPITFILAFGIAHLSTRYYEAFWNRWAHRLTLSPPVSRPVKLQVVGEA